MNPGEDPQIKELSKQLEDLTKRAEWLSHEIEQARSQLDALRAGRPATTQPIATKPGPAAILPELQKPKVPVRKGPVDDIFATRPKTPKPKSDLEKFIGENLINKIGILVLIVGVAIGAKYAIDHQLISPLTRIILGYLTGAGILGFAISLRPKYQPFSAVLLSGSLAIFYFITYFAYAYYSLIPVAVAYTLMVLFTAFAVVAAISYSQVIIAHIGLVGSYAVPFLLSTGSARAGLLFNYIAIINMGILVISFQRNWKSLGYSAFAFTWLIFSSWYLNDADRHVTLTLLFALVFFLTFYTIAIAYKIIRKESFQGIDILFPLANAFIYYAWCYDALDSNPDTAPYLGLFTIGNAVIHFGVAVLMYRNPGQDKNFFYLVSGLVLVFITLAVPVQLDGNWVTLLWMGEAVLTFWIGRSRTVKIYERAAYILVVLAFLSLIQDWSADSTFFGQSNELTPLLNIHFASTFLFAGGLLYFNLHHCRTLNRSLEPVPRLEVISAFLVIGLLIVVYYLFYQEIARYWHQRMTIPYDVTDENGIEVSGPLQSSLIHYRMIWLINYTLAFAAGICWLNYLKIRERLLAVLSMMMCLLALLVFLIAGLDSLSVLRVNYLSPEGVAAGISGFAIGIRYLCYPLVAVVVSALYVNVKRDFTHADVRVAFDLLLHGTTLWIVSSELLNLMDLGASHQSDTFGLSILWGVYALLLISYGIWKKKKHLRIAAIAWFGITLVKLFFYDLAEMGTIPKTIVLVSLGVLLLAISFLYNKYKHLIGNEPEGNR